MFADDTIIYFEDFRLDSIEYVINKQLEKMYSWLCTNKLKLNRGKSKFILIKSARYNDNIKCDIRVANEKLGQVEEYKYLGVIIDNVSSFKKHVQYVIRKMSAKMQFIRRVDKDLSAYVRSVLYKAIVAPHLQYCSTIFIELNKTQIETLQVCQNRALRAVLHIYSMR